MRHLGVIDPIPVRIIYGTRLELHLDLGIGIPTSAEPRDEFNRQSVAGIDRELTWGIRLRHLGTTLDHQEPAVFDGAGDRVDTGLRSDIGPPP